MLTIIRKQRLCKFLLKVLVVLALAGTVLQVLQHCESRW